MDSRIACVIVIVVCLAVVQSRILRQSMPQGDDCSANSQCGPGECCAHAAGRGHFCERYRTAGEGCHRPNNTHYVIYHCGCAEGYVCEHIALDPGHHLGHDDLLHSVEMQLEHTGLGTCQ